MAKIYKPEYRSGTLRGLTIIQQRLNISQEIKYDGENPYLETKDFCICGDHPKRTKHWYVALTIDGKLSPGIEQFPTVISLIKFLNKRFPRPSKFQINF